MILVDTSIWIDHLRKPQPTLARLLEEGGVMIHPLVIEELACGHLMHRSEVLDLLRVLPHAPAISHEEFLSFVVSEHLAGRGLGAIDIHLLASARLAGARIWTNDKILAAAAERLHSDA